MIEKKGETSIWKAQNTEGCLWKDAGKISYDPAEFLS